MKQFNNILTLIKISSLFETTVQNVEELLDIVLETALATVGALNASLLVLDEETNRLKFYKASGKENARLQQLKQVDIPHGVGLAGIVAKTREAIVSNDVQNDKRWLSNVSKKVGIDVKAIACLPLISNSRVLGVVQFLDKQDGSIYSERDMDILDRHARVMAMFFDVSSSNKTLGEEFGRLKEKCRQRYTIVGESPEVRKCIAQAEKVSNSKASILITGESGTGKELFAHLIHNHSLRQTKSFVSISCGALPASILERELFGHEKGAFTGADSQKIGLFEAANGGTLFLDEIGEMPLDMQVKLLRVIQEESFLRLGGTKPTEVDVRIISATNQDLDKMVSEGTFREDLFYRVNVINISLPSLRERKEDIPDLVSFFIRKHTPEGKKPKKVPKGLISYLEGYGWPGNIRQLENAIERAIILEDGDELTPDSFAIESTQSPIEIDVGSTLKEASDSFRKSFIFNTLQTTKGNRTQAAKILGVQRSYLSRLIKELEIS